jgi:hypothetical protein
VVDLLDVCSVEDAAVGVFVEAATRAPAARRRAADAGECARDAGRAAVPRVALAVSDLAGWS